MKLLVSPASPFARKARVVLREAELLDAVTEFDVSTTPYASNPTVVAANPSGRIPALIRTDGPALYDSRVITRFLDDHAGAGLYPQSRLWEILTLEATADGVMEAALLMVYEARFKPAAQQSPEWVEAQWEKASRAVAAINARWMSHLSGPRNMGQIGVGCALGYLDLRHGARDWRADNPALAAWFAEFSNLPAMQATAPS